MLNLSKRVTSRAIFRKKEGEKNIGIKVGLVCQKNEKWASRARMTTDTRLFQPLVKQVMDLELLAFPVNNMCLQKDMWNSLKKYTRSLHVSIFLYISHNTWGSSCNKTKSVIAASLCSYLQYLKINLSDQNSTFIEFLQILNNDDLKLDTATRAKMNFKWSKERGRKYGF